MTNKHMYMIFAILLMGVIVFISLESNKQNSRQTDGENTEASGDGNAVGEATDNTTREVADDAVTNKVTDPTPSTPPKDLYHPIDMSFEIVNTLAKEANFHLHLAEQRKQYRKSFDSGWRPAWYKAAPDLTAEECSKMTTPELARACFASSVFCRELLITRPEYALVKMEVFYPCYGELFNRDDLWKGVAEAYSFLGSRLGSASLEERARIDALITIKTLPHVFRMPKLHEQIEGKELLFVRSLRDALKGIRSYIDPEQGPPGPLFRSNTPVSLINLCVYFMKQYSPSAPEIGGLSRLELSRKPTRAETRAFLDASISEIEGFLDGK